MMFFEDSGRIEMIAADFLSQVHAALAHGARSASERGLTRREIAAEIGVDKSSISRILTGGGNPTARTIAELAAAMGYRPELVLHALDASAHVNQSFERSPILAVPHLGPGTTSSATAGQVFRNLSDRSDHREVA